MKLFSRIGLLPILVLTWKLTKVEASLPDCNKQPTATPSEFTCAGNSGTALADDTYCIESSTIFKVKNGNCESNSLSGLTFFTKTNELVTSSTSSIENFYSCSDSGCETYTPAAGSYYINPQSPNFSSKLVYCSSSSSCSSTEAAKNGSYYPSGTTLIKCTASDCESTTGEGYYVSTKTGYIIECTSTGCSNVAKTSESYFFNAAASGSDSSVGQLIYCNGSTCEALTSSAGNYLNGANNQIIECTNGKCTEKSDKKDFLLSTTPNVLIDCTGSICSLYNAKIGVYVSESGLISCDSTSCNLLTAAELNKVPECNVTGNKCTVKIPVGGLTSDQVNIIPEGGYCIKKDTDGKTVLYFATNTIEREDSMVSSSANNCNSATSTYYQFYYTVGNVIYHIDDSEISQITAAGYYFINTNTNKLVTGSKIEDYNYSYVKLYKCNGTSCEVISAPSSITYYVDVSKRIFKYSGSTFSFAYDKDVLCTYANNKCVPNTDLKGIEFCVTSGGELVIAGGDIEAKKSNNCYKSNNVSSQIFGYSTNLYKLGLYEATIVDTTGYYLVSISSNSTTEYKEFTSKNTDIILYGCNLSSCGLKTPEKQVYYYDLISNYLVKYDNTLEQWVYPTVDGYAYVSVEPGVNYVRKFSIDSTSSSKISLSSKVVDGYYYTVDNEMYECPNTENNSCKLIDESMYYMTYENELYYCKVDNDSLYDTVCNKLSCTVGELYYINGYHFRCVTGNIFNLLSTKYCVKEEQAIINYPVPFSESFPANIKTAIEEISTHNNATSIVKAGSNHLSVIPSIGTNCTYDKEEKTATFDLVCIENYVVIDDNKEAQICSTQKHGFVGCSEDADNPDKCNPSSAITKYLSSVAVAFAMLLFGFIIY